jgi:hypothetical protein
MQRPTAATLATIGLFKLGPRTSHDGLAEPHDKAPGEPPDRAITRQADQRLVRELGLWETFMHGGEKPTIRR